jgi:hypothetical protein
MAWTIPGARRMPKVLETTHNGTLANYVARSVRPPTMRGPVRRFFRVSAANARIHGRTAEDAIHRT